MNEFNVTCETSKAVHLDVYSWEIFPDAIDLLHWYCRHIFYLDMKTYYWRHWEDKNIFKHENTNCKEIHEFPVFLVNLVHILIVQCDN